jgi:hypothetical protein
MSQQGDGNCWKCGKDLGRLDFSRSDTCKSCGFDTRVCKNCKFYDLTANNLCHESQAERQVEKERSNFCDYFTPKTQSGTADATRDQLKNAADALFKKS